MKKIIAFIASLLILNQSSVTAVNAYSSQNLTEAASVRTVGLITLHSLSVKNLNHKLAITSKTYAVEDMKKIGLKNIVIQRSSNNSTWTDYMTLDDMLIKDYRHEIYDYTVDVPTGYYYRVKCDHYAKETGLFPDNESISDTSNSVYIS